MPRLESMRAWSFSRIVIIDILRTRTQDLVCSARHTFSGEWAILKIVWKKRLSGFIASVIEEGALRDDVIVKIVSQLTYALKHIHDRDMMYRNLVPSNILIDMNGVARIFDMSFCSGKTSTSRIGSIPYMAPEVLRMEVYAGDAAAYCATFFLDDLELPFCEPDRTSDYWSLGILTYVLYVRHTPMSIYSAKTDLDHWVDKAYMYQCASGVKLAEYLQPRVVLHVCQRFADAEVIPIVLPKHMAPAAKSLIAGLLVE
ncbi:unnamed protein product, partial [Ixodes persulcatus]